MTAEPIILGNAGTEPLALDLGALIGAHLGIVANSGGGKSGLIRKLLETTHGRIQHIVLDSEDEFYTLRERHDYVIAGGEGGDTPATLDNAAQLAIAALTHGFSLICQINDLGRAGANEFIDKFLTAMIGAPRELWHPCLVVVDEVQRFDETAIGKLTGEGRKRGFTAVLATQRLPKMDANVRGDLNNWIMGRVGQSLDRRNMADQLGMAPSEARALAQIAERHFYAFGPALSREPVLFRVGAVETTMVRPGQAKVHTPPPPEALREILSGLAVAPKQDNQNATDATTDNNRLSDISDEIGRLTAANADLIRANAECAELLANQLDEITELEQQRDRFKAAAEDYRERIGKALHALGIRSLDELDDEDWEAGLKPAAVREVPQAALPANAGGDHEVAQPREKAEGRPSSDSGRPSKSANGKLGAERKPLAALAQVYPSGLTESQWATSAGFKRTGGTWGTYKSRLRTAGLIEQRGDRWFATKEGAGSVGDVELPPRPGPALVRWWVGKLQAVGPMAEILIKQWPEWTSKDDLAGYLGMAASGGTFGTYLSRLAGPEIIERDRDRGVRLNPDMMGRK